MKERAKRTKQAEEKLVGGGDYAVDTAFATFSDKLPSERECVRIYIYIYTYTYI
eukprot:gene846-483_t